MRLIGLTRDESVFLELTSIVFDAALRCNFMITYVGCGEESWRLPLLHAYADEIGTEEFTNGSN